MPINDLKNVSGSERRVKITAMFEIFHRHAYAACSTAADACAPQIRKRSSALFRLRCSPGMGALVPFAQGRLAPI